MTLQDSAGDAASIQKPNGVQRRTSTNSNENPFRPSGDLYRESDMVIKASTITSHEVIIRDPSLPGSPLSSPASPASGVMEKLSGVFRKSAETPTKSAKGDAPMSTSPDGAKHGGALVVEDVAPMVAPAHVHAAPNVGQQREPTPHDIEPAGSRKSEKKTCCVVQ